MKKLLLLLIAGFSFLSSTGCEDDVDTTPWRSVVYPENWQPGQVDDQGRFLHDFSYAGYHRGEKPIPAGVPGPTLNVTKSPYNADSSGANDATAAIQRAIDDAGAGGGGTVFLPAGIYKVRPQGDAKAALFIDKSGVLLKGAGRAATFIYNSRTDMRNRGVIKVSPFRDHDYMWLWGDGGRPSFNLAADITSPTTVIPLRNIGSLKAGDWVILRSAATAEFIADHGQTGNWHPEHMGALTFYRQIVKVRKGRKEIVIDAPTRYNLLRRDGARAHLAPAHIQEAGVQDLSIGMAQVDSSKLDKNEYDTPGTEAYKISWAYMLRVNHAVNSWVLRVNSYRPSQNSEDWHILSNGISLISARGVTVKSCYLKNTQYQGAGGNGYMFAIQGNENLVTQVMGEKGRHNFTFSGLTASGNVLHRSMGIDGRLPSDFHMHLSPANLIDVMTMDGDSYSSLFRDCCNHGHATTQSVIWNIHVKKWQDIKFRNAVETSQFGWGYVIGTSGKVSSVLNQKWQGTEPWDHVEGVNRGEYLVPQSLYEDQLQRRLLQSRSQ